MDKVLLSLNSSNHERILVVGYKLYLYCIAILRVGHYLGFFANFLVTMCKKGVMFYRVIHLKVLIKLGYQKETTMLLHKSTYLSMAKTPATTLLFTYGLNFRVSTSLKK